MQVYRLSKFWTIVVYVSFPPLILFLLYLILEPLLSNTIDGNYWFLSFIYLGFILLLIFALLEAYKGKCILDEDKISLVGAISYKELYYDQIKGYRVNENYIIVESKVKGIKNLAISTYLKDSNDLIAWLDQYYYDLDQVTVQEEEQEILTNDEFGWTKEQRNGRLRFAKGAALFLNVVGTIVCFWVWLYPYPSFLAILSAIAIPIIALLVLKSSTNLIKINEREDTAYPSILLAFMMPSFGLLLNALIRYNLHEYQQAFVVAGTISIVMVFVMVLGNPEFKKSDLETWFLGGSMLVLMAVYGFGLAVSCNALFDTSKGTTYLTKVTNKRISSGKWTTYYVEVQPWGPQKEVEEISVPWTKYENTTIGTTAQISFRQGALGIPWYVLQ